jgi:hypothetical protein
VSSFFDQADNQCQDHRADYRNNDGVDHQRTTVTMNKGRLDRTETPFLPATAAEKGLGGFPLGSLRSRAAARSLLADRKEAEQPEIEIVDDL